MHDAMVNQLSTGTRAGKERAVDRVVMKFGGTSVNGVARLRAVAAQIKLRQDAGTEVIAVVSAMGATTDELVGLVGQLSDRPCPRELDLCLASGESASASLLCIALDALGVPARAYSGAAAGILTAGPFGRAKIVSVDPRSLLSAIEAGIVPVVAGFQGARSDGELTTLGRGGSDTSAVAIAAALNVGCEIYTDVSGVLAADPRVVPGVDARPRMSFEELACMSANGSRVIAQRAVELAATHTVPLQIRSSFTWQPGTAVGGRLPWLETPSVGGVSHDASAVLVSLQGTGSDPWTLAQILTALGTAQVPVSLVARADFREGSTTIDLVLRSDDLKAAYEALTPVVLGRGGRINTDTSRTLVSVVGVGLTSYPGVAGTVAATVGDVCAHADLLVASPSVITWLVPDRSADELVRALCDALALSPGAASTTMAATG